MKDYSRGCNENSKFHCEQECDSMDFGFQHQHQHQHHHPHHKMSESCHVPKVKSKCGPTCKECVKTYKCCYKLYKFTKYCLYKVCSSCGHEFDHYHHNGICPKCK